MSLNNCEKGLLWQSDNIQTNGFWWQLRQVCHIDNYRHRIQYRFFNLKIWQQQWKNILLHTAGSILQNTANKVMKANLQRISEIWHCPFYFLCKFYRTRLLNWQTGSVNFLCGNNFLFQNIAILEKHQFQRRTVWFKGQDLSIAPNV